MCYASMTVPYGSGPWSSRHASAGDNRVYKVPRDRAFREHHGQEPTSVDLSIVSTLV